jgi:mRNA-degrading endonuclease YafQ of YafQ-DinJ toxin-antitoxin module
VSYRIVYTKSYIRRASRFIRKHPDMVRQYEKTLKLLELNPSHPSLKLHALSGRLKGLHAVSINIAYRITLEFIIDNDTIVPVDVGSHDDVYR